METPEVVFGATSMPTISTPTRKPKAVDLGGDVEIIVGPEGCQASLLVSRALLSLVSPYFKAIFGPTYTESKAVEEGKPITLKEDEPDAVVNLCKILHMRYEWPKPMGHLELLSLATVVDKYGCIKAINLSLDALFPSEISGKVLGSAAVLNLVVASYILDHPKLFHKYSQCLMMEYADSLSTLTLNETGQRVPSIAWLILEGRRVEAWKSLSTALTQVVFRPCTADFKNCMRMTDWFSRQTNNLRTVGLERTAMANHSISSALNKAGILTVVSPIPGLSCCGTVVGTADNQKFHPLPTTQHQFNALVETARSKCKGLCLDCVRAGGTFKGQCRVDHS